MPKMLLGTENAEHDNLLFECAIHKDIKPYKSIITGRWGTGKTALLLLQNEKLKNELERLGEDWKEIMYLDEDGMNITQILSMYEQESELMFGQKIELIWKAEIIRRGILLLNALIPIYHNIDTKLLHWKIIKNSGRIAALHVPFWKQIPNIVKFIANSSERSGIIEDVNIDIGVIFNRNIFREVQKCLKDIEQEEIKPRIIVEPIDAPTSPLEEHSGMAQTIMTSLLNVYQSTFVESDYQLLRVDIAIPWHRYSVLKMNFPQKLISYKTYMTWSNSELRNFINNRIEFEFKRVGRHYSKKGDNDAWDVLFAPTIKNEYCVPHVAEDSFDYILRHTHHRPRELQRITRNCIERCAEKLNRKEEDILKGKAGIKISDSHIKEAVREFTVDAWKSEILVEAQRRFSNLNTIISNIYALPVPFSIDELKKRLGESIKIEHAIDHLWQSGIIGLRLECLKNNENKDCYENCRERINILPTNGAKKKHTNNENTFCCSWTLFEYNWSGDLNEIIQHFQSDDMIDIKYIIHPKGFESLLPKVTTKWPIGI